LGGLVWILLRIEPLNKRRLGEAVLRAGGFATEEPAARAVNAEPWDPMPHHGETGVPRVPLLLRRTCKQPRTALPGMRGQAAPRDPAVTSVKVPFHCINTRKHCCNCSRNSAVIGFRRAA
jgi:hypothetical protein